MLKPGGSESTNESDRRSIAAHRQLICLLCADHSACQVVAADKADLPVATGSVDVVFPNGATVDSPVPGPGGYSYPSRLEIPRILKPRDVRIHDGAERW